MPVTHAYNPTYSGGRDQEDWGLWPAWANSSVRLYLKKPLQKRTGGVADGVGPEFKLWYIPPQKKPQTTNVGKVVGM
jgi:hypothetical protein